MLLIYLKLFLDMEGLGFRLNPYDPCVSNIVVYINQHAEESDITNVIEWFKGKYGNVRVSRVYKA